MRENNMTMIALLTGACLGAIFAVHLAANEAAWWMDHNAPKEVTMSPVEFRITVNGDALPTTFHDVYHAVDEARPVARERPDATIQVLDSEGVVWASWLHGQEATRLWE
jgi:hypothetical protein